MAEILFAAQVVRKLDDSKRMATRFFISNGARSRVGRRLPVLTLLFALLAWSGLAFAEQRSLILAVHPYLPYQEVTAKFAGLANYLARRLGYGVSIRVGKDYQEHIQFIGDDRVDLAFLGPASYVALTREHGQKPLLAKLAVRGRPFFQGKIIARKDAGIKTLADLRGRRFAFGDPVSTMSHLVPRFMLLENGIPLKALAGHEFLGSHDNVALGVLVGDFDAGAVKEEVFMKFEANGLVAIATTVRVSEHLFVARADLEPKLVEALRAAL
ncbi:MAG: phosphate/phosphite/phosphonate ABC transporter substrate-binding protein [Gammaproteobacteria bacterium]|nr:MAG: phosphate/phosphite/phosphonate ABC transporter substrate-binding protein [Gammaproteobacteria bacterium]